MGGNLAVTMRLSDGTQYRMDRWTNSLPETLVSSAFRNEEPEAIAHYLKPWLNMKADWEANAETGSFQHNMTEAYAPYPFGLRPSEYGTVVICFQTKTILSLQGYANLSRKSWYAADLGFPDFNPEPEEAEEIALLQKQGCIAAFEVLTKNQWVIDKILSSLPGTKMVPVNHERPDTLIRLSIAGANPVKKVEDTLKAVYEPYRGHDARPYAMCSIRIDLKPFTVETFRETAEGYRAMLARIGELGFELSDEETAAWEAVIAERSAED